MRWKWALVVAGVAFLAYANALRGEFVWDDLTQVVRNPWVTQPSAVGRAFVSGFHDFGAFTSVYYRPAGHAVAAGTYALFGLSPVAFHLVNVLLHVLACLCVYRVASRWSPGTPAVLGALLFAVHPVQVEAVAWISGVYDVAYSLLVLAALAAVVDDRPRVRFLSVVAFAAALLWKEPAVAFLPVAVAYLVARGELRARPRETVALVAGLAAVLVAYLLVRVLVLGSLGGKGRNPIVVSGMEMVLTGVALLGEYVRMLLVPYPLSAVHHLTPVTSPLDPRFALGIGACLALGAAAWWARRRPEVLAALLLVVVPILPTLYLPALHDFLFAERYLYLPSAGLALLVALGLQARPSRALRAGVATVIAAFLVLTATRTSAWHDSLALWGDAVAKAPGSPVAHEYLGTSLITERRYEEAVAELSRSLEIDPARPDARTNLSVALGGLGRLQEAIDQADLVLRKDPGHSEALSARGWALGGLGRWAEAAEALERSLAMDPWSAPTHNTAGVVYLRLGRPDVAAHHFRAAVQLDPGNALYRRNLAGIQP